MENNERRPLTDKERTLIAMGAAMGAGCRKCAEGLRHIGDVLGITTGEAGKAFEIGLNAKAQAVNTMRAVACATLYGEANSAQTCGCTWPGVTRPAGLEQGAGSDSRDKTASLIRLASFMAANSAPDAHEGIEEAVAHGAGNNEIKLCLGIARMVREKAAGFSDDEVNGTQQEGTAGNQTGDGCGEQVTCAAACSCGGN
jgi:hypothetical protein